MAFAFDAADWIVSKRKIRDRAAYDVSNKSANAIFDGISVKAFNRSGAGSLLLADSFYSTLSVDMDGITHTAKQDSDVTYRMKGHTYKGDFYVQECHINSRLSTKCDGCIVSIHLVAIAKRAFTLRWNYGFAYEAALTYLANEDIILREKEGAFCHFTLQSLAEKTDDSYRAELVLILAGEPLEKNAAALCAEIESDAACYNEYLSAVVKNDEDKPLRVWALNTALSMYKEFDGFKGFFAGINYFAPARTYFRDGYYTALAVLPYKPDYVKNQLITLATGVEPDGACGSAVDANFHTWWSNHHDSPMFFVMLLYAYVKTTKDEELLALKCGTRSIRDTVRAILDRLMGGTDSNGLLYRKPLDRHDWADNIYREGYVTYDECLLYAALSMGAKLLNDDSYAARAQLAKTSINKYLWNEQTGCYYNFKSADKTEDNCSLDTVFAALCGIAQGDRRTALLTTMEKLLESKNNKAVDDFGVMCVYPCYKYPETLVEKSAYEYRYHNGADWPYLSSLYALAKKLNGMEYRYPLTRWIEYCKRQDWYTPVEYYSPYYPKGSNLQGWSSFLLVALDLIEAENIFI